MIVSVMSTRAIQKSTQNDDVVGFGAQAIVNLIPKVTSDDIKSGIFEKIIELFLHV